MDRTTFRDPNQRFETADYKVVVGDNPDPHAPACFKRTYFILDKRDGVVAGHGNQLPGLINATVLLQQNLNEVLAQMTGPPGQAN